VKNSAHQAISEVYKRVAELRDGLQGRTNTLESKMRAILEQISTQAQAIQGDMLKVLHISSSTTFLSYFLFVT
jgi:hypothetical protein